MVSLKDEIALTEAAAEKQFKRSLSFGGIGLVLGGFLLFGGIVFGLLAFLSAVKAERLGHPKAIIGKILGSVDILANLVGIVVAVIYLTQFG
jgi:hypothetical protein